LIVLTAVTTACAIVVPAPDIVIGTASPTSAAYPLGGSICRLFNLESPKDGRRCAAIPTSDPIANIDMLRDGRIDVAIVPSDVLADAAAGNGVFDSRGPSLEMRVLFSGYSNAFTIVVRGELGIRSAVDLRGRRINMGSPGSGERISMERIMASAGVTRGDFAQVHEMTLAEQHRAFCAKEIDAIVYEVPHPSGLIQDLVRGCNGALVDIVGKSIDGMLRHHPEYERTVIPGGTYAANSSDVQTIGVRSVVIAASRLSDDLAYEITKAVFENFDDFRRLHPAFAMLSIPGMVNADGPTPLHSGALRYYRERGNLP
tara:strand:+ start:9282 stop:10226 length:945 start_codon:yes stop_codon:yes gene_type:complete